jgi:hypothetical protein
MEKRCVEKQLGLLVSLFEIRRHKKGILAFGGSFLVMLASTFEHTFLSHTYLYMNKMDIVFGFWGCREKLFIQKLVLHLVCFKLTSIVKSLSKSADELRWRVLIDQTLNEGSV